MRPTLLTVPSTASAADPCPLCGTVGASSWLHEPGRDYWRCLQCALVFLSSAQRLTRDAEVARYALHDNRDDDPKYVAFLSRLAEPVIARVPAGATGLDYGSGQSAALALLLTRANRPTSAYDPAFRPDESLLAERYDFVTCSEVLEHVHHPRAFFPLVAGLLKPGGLLAFMTGMYVDAAAFADWWYRRDPTHVCFYNEATFRWVASTFGWQLDLPAPNVATFRVTLS